MSGDYEILAPVYETLHLASFAQAATPRLLDYAQRNDWMGRRIIDLGCGTGTSLHWLAKRGYVTAGVDNSSDMLNIARVNLATASLSVHLIEEDIRQLEVHDDYDMAIALNLFNEFESLRDLEAAFKRVNALLAPQRLFIFDMLTIEGLIKTGTRGAQVAHDDPTRLTVIESNQFDYERQELVRSYKIFRYESYAWHRSDATWTRRAYPVQAVATLLNRRGFEVVAVLDPAFTVYDPRTTSELRAVASAITDEGTVSIPRVFFIARNQ